MKLRTSWVVVVFFFIFLTVQFSQAMLQSSQTIGSAGSIAPSVVTYFQCTFSKVGPEGYKLNQPWVREEPCAYPNELGIWSWVNCGPDWGSIRIVKDPTDASRYCIQMTLDAPGERPLPNNQHVKLYECQSRDSENYVEPYPTLKEAYYSAKYWFPSDFKVDSWRLIWQYCGEEGLYGTEGFKNPQLSLVFNKENLLLKNNANWRADGIEAAYPLIKISELRKNTWVPIDIYVKQGSQWKNLDGKVIVWINGVKILEAYNISTATKTGTPYIVWGIGNYGGQREAQGQYILIKDVTVTSERQQ